MSDSKRKITNNALIIKTRQIKKTIYKNIIRTTVETKINKAFLLDCGHAVYAKNLRKRIKSIDCPHCMFHDFPRDYRVILDSEPEYENLIKAFDE